MLKLILIKFIYTFNMVVIGYVLLVSFFYFLLDLVSFFKIKKYIKELDTADIKKIFNSSFRKPVSILIPARNEGESIKKTVDSMLNLRYPELEIIVINDESSDDTLNILIKEFNLIPVHCSVQYTLKCSPIKQVYYTKDHHNLIVVDKEHGKNKSDALNAGINMAKYPYFCVIDSDSILEDESLLKLTRPFIEHPSTVAVGGIVRIANGCDVQSGRVLEVGIPKNHLVRFQIIEYIRAFLFGRLGLDVFNSLLIISGTFSMFKKEAVVEIGGYRLDSIGEDMDLVVRLHKVMREKNKKYRITFIPDPVCFTTVPESIKVLAKQRSRWQRGLMDSLFHNIKMLGNPRYGMTGMFGMTSFLFIEMLSAIVESVGFFVAIVSWYFGIINLNFVILLAVSTIMFGILLSTSALCLEEMSFKRYTKMSHVLMLYAYSFIENFGYRQLTVLLRLKGTIDYFIKKRDW